MKGKTVVVTGASSGIGLVIGRSLAARGASVIMLGRDAERSERAWLQIGRAATGKPPVLLRADLSSQAEVRRVAAEIGARAPRIDVLINNAGGIFAQRELTVDGIERTFATNHLAPFLLTSLLLDPLRAAPGGRVVVVASEAYPGTLDFANLQGEKSYHFLAAYTRSKLANILFTYELGRRLAGSRVTANCMSPGPTRTRFGDDLTGLPRLFPIFMKRIPFLFAAPAKGAATAIDLAASPELGRISGRFFMRGRERHTKAITYDRTVAARLWSVSEALCDSVLAGQPAPIVARRVAV